MPLSAALHRIATEALAFGLAATCPGCDRPGTLLCEDCRAELRPQPREVRTPAGLRVRAALGFEGAAARCIRRLKDDGQTLLAFPLGAALGSVLDELVAEDVRGERLWIVPIPTSPSSFRRRGFRVPELLVRRAGYPREPLLRTQGRRGDQRALDARSRATNVSGSMRAAAGGCDGRIVLVDDVTTTGATLDEAARVLAAAGGDVIAAATLAATPHRAERPINTSETRRK